eukprot:14986322-Ditylum_brightwellii.AAC.1
MQVMKCAAITTTEEVHPVIGENAIWKIDTCGVQNKSECMLAYDNLLTYDECKRRGGVLCKKCDVFFKEEGVFQRMPRKALTFAVTENSTCRQGVVILKWGYLIPLARTEITQSREKAHK